jgi:hypothetical protein
MIYDLPSTRSVCFHVNGAMAAGRLLHRRKFQHSFARRIACRRPNSAGANRGTLHDAHGTRSPWQAEALVPASQASLPRFSHEPPLLFGRPCSLVRALEVDWRQPEVWGFIASELFRPASALFSASLTGAAGGEVDLTGALVGGFIISELCLNSSAFLAASRAVALPANKMQVTSTQYRTVVISRFLS